MSEEKSYESVREFSNLFKFEPRAFIDEQDDTCQALDCKFVRSFEYTNKKDETFTVHVVSVADGSERQIFGTGILDHLLSKIEEGEEIRIVYQGLEDGVDEKISKTGKLNHFDVLRAL